MCTACGALHRAILQNVKVTGNRGELQDYPIWVESTSRVTVRRGHQQQQTPASATAAPSVKHAANNHSYPWP